MPTRNQNILSLSSLSAVLLLVVLLLLNVAAARTRVRVDLTEEGLYTLGAGSRRVLEGLRDPATLKVFWHNVPEQAQGQERDLEALLDEMEAAAGGRLAVRWVDMDSEEGQREAEQAGVQKMEITAVQAGEITAKASYASLVVEVQDQQEQVEVLNQGPQLEYEILSRLHGMTTEPPGVGLVAPEPAFNPFGGQAQGRFGVFRQQVLREQFGESFRSSVNLDEPVPPDLKVLVVAAPEDLSPKQVFHLEQFLLGGGRVLLLLDPVHADVGRPPNPEPTDSGLDDWLAHLGVTVEEGVVGDYRNFLMRIQRRETARGPVAQLVEYPYWPLLRYAFLDEENPAIRNFDQIPLFWPQPLALDTAKQEAAGREGTVLGSTSNAGYHRPDLIGLDDPRDPVTQEDLTSIPVMVQLEGPMTSFWKGRKTPLEEEAEAAAAEAAADEAMELPGAGEVGPGEGDVPAPPPPDDGMPPDETAPPDEDAPPAPDGGAAEGSPDGDASANPPADAPAAPPEAPDDAASPPEAAPPADAPTGDADADAPEDPEEGASDAGNVPALEEEPEGPPRLDEGRGLLVVVTDAELVADMPLMLARQLAPLGMGAPYQGGFGFVLNVVEWMGGSEDLLSLRARTGKPRQIEEVEPEKQKLLTWLNILGVPVLVLFLGVVVWIVRRYQR